VCVCDKIDWMENGWMDWIEWMWMWKVESGKWQVDVESGKWRGSGSHSIMENKIVNSFNAIVAILLKGKVQEFERVCRRRPLIRVTGEAGRHLYWL